MTIESVLINFAINLADVAHERGLGKLAHDDGFVTFDVNLDDFWEVIALFDRIKNVSVGGLHRGAGIRGAIDDGAPSAVLISGEEWN